VSFTKGRVFIDVELVWGLGGVGFFFVMSFGIF
jgi:hypothetical protein